MAYAGFCLVWWQGKVHALDLERENCEAGRLSVARSSLSPTTTMIEKGCCLASIMAGREDEEALQRCTFVTYQRVAAAQLELQLISGTRNCARGCRDSTTCAVLGQNFCAGAEVA